MQFKCLVVVPIFVIFTCVFHDYVCFMANIIIIIIIAPAVSSWESTVDVFMAIRSTLLVNVLTMKSLHKLIVVTNVCTFLYNCNVYIKLFLSFAWQRTDIARVATYIARVYNDIYHHTTKSSRIVSLIRCSAASNTDTHIFIHYWVQTNDINFLRKIILRVKFLNTKQLCRIVYFKSILVILSSTSFAVNFWGNTQPLNAFPFTKPT